MMTTWTEKIRIEDRCQECGDPAEVRYWWRDNDATQWTHYCADCAQELGVVAVPRLETADAQDRR